MGNYFCKILPMIHTFPIISGMLRITSKVFPLLLRKYYTSTRLDQLIKLDVSASGDGVTYYHPRQEAICWLGVTNLSPFDFSIDRIKMDVDFDAGSFSCTGIIPEMLKGSESRRICVRSRSPMTIEAARFAKEKSTHARVSVQAYIVSSIRSFTVTRYIDDVKNFQINA